MSLLRKCLEKGAVKSSSIAVTVFIISLTGLTMAGAQQPWRNVDIGAPVPPPVLLSPDDGAETNDTTPTFYFDNVLPVDTFTIQIDTDLNGSADFSTYDEYSGISDRQVTATPLAEGTYYWRAKMTRGGFWSNWSDVRSLVITSSGGPLPEYEWTILDDWEVGTPNANSGSEPLPQTPIIVMVAVAIIVAMVALLWGRGGSPAPTDGI